MGLGGGGGGKKKRSWDDDAGILVRMVDKILPDFDEWGIDKKTRISRTNLRSINENAWSSGIIHIQDSRYMMYFCCCCGTCIQHGHNQDLVDNTGCCIPCMTACIPAVHCCELTRARRNLRVRMGIKGRWYVDCLLTMLCPCLTVCQETREIEMRTKQIWHPIWGFRVKTPLHSSIFLKGKDPLMPEILFGENRLTDALPFETDYPAWGEQWNTMEHYESYHNSLDLQADLPTATKGESDEGDGAHSAKLSSTLPAATNSIRKF